MFVSFAIPILVIPFLINMLICTGVMAWMISGDYGLFEVLLTGGFSVFPILLVSILVYGRALSIVRIDKKGIRNCRVNLTWEEIGATKAIEIEPHRFYKTLFLRKGMDIACFSLEKEDGGFWGVNTKKVVMLRMSKKTYNVINQYARGKNEVVDKFLDSIDWYKYRD